jgi:hypothetical protein
MTARWLVSVRLPTSLASLNVGLLGHLERVVHLDAKMSDGTYPLRMTEQQLNSPEICRPSADQRRFGATHRVRAVGRVVKPHRFDHRWTMRAY